MIKWIEVTGKTEQIAIDSGLEQLGLDRDDVSVEILERAKSGFLGIGATPAKVKMSYEVEEPKEDKVVIKEEPKEEKPVIKQEAKPEKVEEPIVSETVVETDSAKKKAEDTAQKEEKVAEIEEQDVEVAISDFLTGLLRHMESEAIFEASRKNEDSVQVVFQGENLGMLIGHRGETLDSIQQLTNFVVNRNRAKRVRVHVDVENYRAKREEALKRLAIKMAGKAVQHRKNMTLEPMNAYERHVIHEALQGYDDIVTYSKGTEPNRRTVIAYSKGKHTY